MPLSYRNPNNRLWMFLSAIFFVTTILLLIVVIILAARDNDDDDAAVCGEGSNPNGNSIDLSDPDNPDIFHDLTEDELIKLRAFLEQDPQIKATKVADINLNANYLYTADLFLPNKSDVLQFLDQKNGAQPERRARVIMFRGDLPTPVVEEYICGPLPTVTSCELMQLEGRRNPAQFSLRPVNLMEYGFVYYAVFVPIDKELGYILKESYQTTITDCGTDGICLTFNPVPFATSLTGSINKRSVWLNLVYSVEYLLLHPVDFALLVNVDGVNSSQWSIEKIWYAGQIYNTTDDLIRGYNASSIPVSRMTKPVPSADLYSTLKMKGDPMPKNSQRPPKLVEPDGKRYSVKHQKVEYLDWTFHFRMSAFSGPAVYDVRFKGERIVYELGLQELGVFYSSHSPDFQTTNFLDSNGLLGVSSKALVLGGDCPETATLIPNAFMAQHHVNVAKFPHSMCLFEQNDGTPLRRKLAYSQTEGGFYSGILNSALVLRSIIALGNYDYVVDYIFYQTGALETSLMSTGSIASTRYSDEERKYAFRIQDTIGGSLHHHLVHFKADLDISGTSNRYETIDFSKEDVSLTTDPSQQFELNKYSKTLKETEQDALYKYNFDTPKYHIVHNNAQRTNYGEVKAYRLQINGMSKQLLSEGKYNEKTIPWARHQLAVTKQKDHEFWSSSSYAMWDSADPVVDFSQFYSDNDNITDEDLVLWISMGMHHLPHTEDLPLTTTVGNALNFFLFPYNYFPECPSVSSRDAIRVNLKNQEDRTQGVEVTRYQKTASQCTFPLVDLENQFEQNPDSILESNNPSPVL